MKSPKMKAITLVACALCLVAGLFVATAQTGNDSPEKAIKQLQPEGQAPATPSPEEIAQRMAKVAVTVNGKNITEGDLIPGIQQEISRLTRGGQIPPAFIQQLAPRLRGKVLDKMIAEQLLLEEVAKENIVITDEEILKEITTVIEQRGIAKDLESFKQMIAAEGENFEDIKAQVKRGLSIQQLISKHVDDQIKVTADDTKAYYDEHTEEFEVPEKVKVSHILISTESKDPNADPNEIKAEAKTKADALLTQLKDGADFAELAMANSSCPSAEKGGDLGMLTKGQTVAPFEEAAFALEVGKLSDVVETRFGYHIIKVAQHDDAKQLTYEEAQEDIQKQLETEKSNSLADAYVTSLKEKATIVYPEPEVTEAPEASEGIEIKPVQP